jgi:ketose-bisphosphate aldolase
MPFVPSLELVGRAAREGYAIPSFCVWNAEMIELVLRVAAELRAPVMLMHGPAEQGLMRPAAYATTAWALAARYDVPAALHLDHGDSVPLAEECLKAGYTSLMLDYSARPFVENVAALQQVTAMAHPKDVSVEGELGTIGRADNIIREMGHTSTLTDPQDAQRYVTETGVDMLAVSIGNAHGHYAALPRFEFGLLAELHAAVPVPLVLHGGSGTPEADLQRAISLGIAKVNIASDLVRALRESVRAQWQEERNLWLPMALAEGMRAVAPVVERWIRIVGAAGRA